MICQGVFRK